MNILHLSDIHFGRNYPEYGLKDPFEKHDKIVDGIIEKPEKMDDTLNPEHIFLPKTLRGMARKKNFPRLKCNRKAAHKKVSFSIAPVQHLFNCIIIRF